MEKLVQSIFSFEFKAEKLSESCLSTVFDMMRRYLDKTNQYPDSSIVMFNEFESLFIYMLQLGEQNNIDIDRVINFTDETGQSLFYLYSLFSEKISHELIRRNVKVNRIDNEFSTPYFRVNYILYNERFLTFLQLYLVPIYETIDD